MSYPFRTYGNLGKHKLNVYIKKLDTTVQNGAFGKN